ncbi:MAG: hypothetical protein LBQ83_03735 [Candidatus Margulisbacteria bacterium]|jgi:hypothetical protein|nr:hypothetical protein [Candidatus Margulisiibacteriota bacterium]
MSKARVKELVGFGAFGTSWSDLDETKTKEPPQSGVKKSWPVHIKTW